MNKRWRSRYVVLTCVVPLVALAIGWRALDRYDHSPTRTHRITGSTRVLGTPGVAALFKDLDTGWPSTDWTGVGIPTPSPFFDARPRTMKFKPRQRLGVR